MEGENRKKILVLIKSLIFIGVFLSIYHFWFFSLAPITHSDWGYYFNETLTSIRSKCFSLWFPNLSFGHTLLDVGQAPTYALAGLLGFIPQLNYAIIERLVWFWPIVVFTPLSSFLLLKSILKNRVAVLIGVCVYSFNTYFLILQTGHITLMGASAFAPLAIFFFKKTLEQQKWRDIVLTGCVCFLVSVYEPRIFYIIAWLLLFYTIYFIFVIDKKFNSPLKVINQWAD